MSSSRRRALAPECSSRGWLLMHHRTSLIPVTFKSDRQSREVKGRKTRLNAVKTCGVDGFRDKLFGRGPQRLSRLRAARRSPGYRNSWRFTCLNFTLRTTRSIKASMSETIKASMSEKILGKVQIGRCLRGLDLYPASRCGRDRCRQPKRLQAVKRLLQKERQMETIACLAPFLPRCTPLGRVRRLGLP